MGDRGAFTRLVAAQVFLLLSILSPHDSSAREEKAVLRVVLNEEDKGEYVVVLTEEGDVLLAGTILKEIGLRGIPGGGSIPEERILSLKSLSPDVTFSVDGPTSTLVLTANPRLLQKQVVDLGRPGHRTAIPLVQNTGFINYSLEYDRGDDPGSASISVPLEAGVQAGRLLGFSSFSYARNEMEEKFVRMSSNLIRDDPEHVLRWVLGDFTAFSGVLGGGGSYGGISVFRTFSLDPYFVSAPGVEVAGVVQTPSDVDVYVNHMLVRKEKLSPGEFTIANLPVHAGPGTASLVIRDAFGRTETIGIPYYFSSSLLKPGLQDFRYNVGFRRDGIGEKNFDYGEPAFTAFHRIGLNESFTGGLRAEAGEDLVNVGLEATFLPWQAGEVDSALAFSSGRERVGLAGYLSYGYIGNVLNGRVSVKSHTRDYANISLAADADKSKFDGSAGIGIRLKPVGAISATYAFSRKYIGTDMKQASLYYTRNLSRNISLTASLIRSSGEGTETSFSAGLHVNLGDNRYGSVSHQAQDDGRSTSADVAKGAPRGPGLGYAFRAERREDDGDEPETNGSATLDYNANRIACTAGYGRTAGENRYNLRAFGALVYVDGSIRPTRVVHDGFALVKVGELEGVRIYANNQVEGATNGNGEILLPNLVSYLDNKISLEPLDVPVDHGITEFEKYVAPPYRGGGTVTFDAPKLQGFMGHIYLVEKGKKKAAEYYGLDMTVDGTKKEGIIGRDGEFYFENVPPGGFPARVFQKDKECRFTLTIPKSDKPIVDLGEIDCEMD